MLELAGVLLLGAAGRAVNKVAAEGWRVLQRRQRLRILGPVDQLLAGDEVDVGQSQDGVDELEEALLTVNSESEDDDILQVFNAALSVWKQVVKPSASERLHHPYHSPGS